MFQPSSTMIPDMIADMNVFGQPFFDSMWTWIGVIIGIGIVGIFGKSIIEFFSEGLQKIFISFHGKDDDDNDYTVKHEYITNPLKEIKHTYGNLNISHTYESLGKKNIGSINKKSTFSQGTGQLRNFTQERINEEAHIVSKQELENYIQNLIEDQSGGVQDIGFKV